MSISNARLTARDAQNLARETLERIGLPGSDAQITAQHLITAELRGYPSHGLRRIPGIASIISSIGADTRIIVEVSKPGFLLFDGNSRLGIAAVTDALDAAAEKLGQEAAIVLGVTNYVGTTGSLGIYSEALATRGLGSILMCSSEYAVAPHGSSRAILGTNPIAVALPASPVSFCADVATAASSYGAIKDAAIAGRTLPLGIVQTSSGGRSSDPNDADNGSILPMAGHKGYALGLAVELLCGPLIGGKAGREAVAGSDGFFGILFRADCARPAEMVNADAQALFAEILNSQLAEDANDIRIPGDQSSHKQRHVSEIEVRNELLETLRQLGR